MVYQVSKKSTNLEGEISLNGSKSISNRALIIRALSGHDFEIANLSNAKDTTTLQKLLAQEGSLYDTGAAGTTFRFLTAYLSMQDSEQTLTGSARMKERPIGILVDALSTLGANIEYLERPGYPPLKIKEPNIGANNSLSIAADTSSQYISALLMLAPKLPNGLILKLEGDIVSLPYIEMTLNMLRYFGIDYEWENQVIRIPNQKYKPKDFKVEADWSAASYYFIMAALADKVDLQLNGLWKKSVQGDAIIADLAKNFGIQTNYNEKGIHLTKPARKTPDVFEWDFIKCPDIAQSLAVACAGLGTKGLFTGLQTLKIKETDRILALKNELLKTNVVFSELPSSLSNDLNQNFYLLEGVTQLDNPLFETYDDHRMAMAFAPLAMQGTVRIEDPLVVVKSYPGYWEDLKSLGFVVEEC